MSLIGTTLTAVTFLSYLYRDRKFLQEAPYLITIEAAQASVREFSRG